jgi:NAD-dependent dihydropyrimidine dehydrogenase PreA subunit
MTAEAAAKKPTRKRRGHVKIRESECKGCGLCVDACPQNVLELSSKLNRMGYRSCSYTGEGCIACGICFYACPEPGAITVYELEEGE